MVSVFLFVFFFIVLFVYLQPLMLLIQIRCLLLLLPILRSDFTEDEATHISIVSRMIEYLCSSVVFECWCSNILEVMLRVSCRSMA